jgi:hypothetical protein
VRISQIRKKLTNERFLLKKLKKCRYNEYHLREAAIFDAEAYLRDADKAFEYRELVLKAQLKNDARYRYLTKRLQNIRRSKI